MRGPTPDPGAEDAQAPAVRSVDAELVARTAERDRMWDLSAGMAARAVSRQHDAGGGPRFDAVAGFL